MIPAAYAAGGSPPPAGRDESLIMEDGEIHQPDCREQAQVRPLALPQYEETQWYAVYTKAKHEKKVAEGLAERQISSFLPLRRILSKWKDRRKLIELPLFPGYIFVDIDLKDRIRVLRTPGVVRMVGFQDGKPVPIPREQIHAIMRFLEENANLEPYPYLEIGNRVEIIRGSFRGIRGILVRKKKGYRFVISVDLIRQSAAIEIDAEDVVPVK